MVRDKVKRHPRLLGLLVFFGLVGAVQVAEQLFFWYLHREDRVHLVELREELVDAGAAMIDAQLDARRIRHDLETVDHTLHAVRSELEGYVRYASAGPVPGRLHGHFDAEVESFNSRIRQRNEHLVELNDAIIRRNAAARHYHVLADSIRRIAARAREPYFTIPLPAEAAVRRGVAAVDGTPPLHGVAPRREGPTFGAGLHEAAGRR